MAAKKKVQRKADPKSSDKFSPVVARNSDGTIQITFTLAWLDIKRAMEEGALELGKSAQISGFRKGNAPLPRLMSHFSKETLIEKALQRLLPKLLAETIEKHKIKPATYPKFELVKATEGEDWSVRAVTCEIPVFELGDYKKVVAGAFTARNIWTPEKGKEKPKELTREEKEIEAMRALLSTVKLTIPTILIKEEVDSKLSSLLERLEKLGLSLESYLSSVNKTPEKLREEYSIQAENTIKLEFILNRIADQEPISVLEEEVENFIKATGGDQNLQKKLETPEQKLYVRSVLKKRKVLDMLIALG